MDDSDTAALYLFYLSTPLLYHSFLSRNFLKNATKRTDIVVGPSGPEVISLQKVDSLLCLVNVREAK